MFIATRWVNIAVLLLGLVELVGPARALGADPEAALSEPDEVSSEPKAVQSQAKAAEKDGASSKEKKPAGEKRPRGQNPRVLLITTKDNARCEKELARLGQPGRDFELMRSKGWKIGPGPENHLQIVDQEEVAELLEQFETKEYPLVMCVNGKGIVRSFKSGCTTPLDMWTFGWLAKGIDERPPGMIPEAARVETTGNYPLRGNHWSIDEIWNPSREQVIAHFRGPTHAHMIRAHWKIETWSYEELRSMHDNLHEQEMGGVQPMRNYQAPPTRSGPDLYSAGRKTR